MSTRATIKFTDRDKKYFVYRHSGGFPENVQEDLRETIRTARDRWRDPELSLLVTLFLVKGYDYKQERLPYYEITENFHGDESYRYYCRWNKEHREWEFGVMD